MRRLHPLTLALLSAHGLEAIPPLKKEDAKPPEPALKPAPRFMINRDDHRRIRPLMGLTGMPVRPEYRPSGDQNPEGKAAKRRRKQMERQKAAQMAREAADSCDSPRADRQDLAHQDGMVEIFPQVFADPEILEDLAREITAELTKSGMVIIDDVGVVPPEVWLAEPPPPEGSWVKPLLDLENRAAHERHKGTITFPTATPSGWGEIEQSKGDDHGNADAADADGLPDRGPGEADPGGIRG